MGEIFLSPGKDIIKRAFSKIFMETEEGKTIISKGGQRGLKCHSIVLPELVSKIFNSIALFTVNFSLLNYNVIQRALQRNLACM